MKRRRFCFIIAILAALLLAGSVIVLAAGSSPSVNTGEIHDDDFIAEGDSVTNDGIITGDLLSFSQRLTVRGGVEGDIIAFATDIYIGGEVGGSIRAVGSNISISSRVSRNVMLAGSSCILDNGSSVARNVYLVGNVVKSLGTVEGTTNIFGSDITLGGVYNGDVVIHNTAEKGSFSMQPGTVIRGKLTYKGATEFHLPSYVQVGDYEFVKTSPAESGRAQGLSLGSIIKRITTLAVYYLLALLLFRLFPRFFVRSGSFISQKPFAAAGIGIATLGTLVGALLLLLIIILLVMTILEFSVLGFTSLALLFFGLVTVVFADIPVSLWLGGMMLRKTGSVPARLAVGLAVISAVKLVLDLLSVIPSVGSVFGVIGFLVRAAVWLLGTGAILNTLYSMLKAANQQAVAEELGITEE